MFADDMSNFDLHMVKINTNGLALLSNHRRPLRSRHFEKAGTLIYQEFVTNLSINI